jgi:membrane-associated protease RseP (regulator of RpoE activity)
VLVLFEAGRAPFKYGAGKFGEELKWQAHPGDTPTAQAACVAVGSQCVVDKFMVGADVGFQATTRGGRPIDAVLGGKASFKEGAQTVSTVASTIGAVGLQTALVTGNRDSGGIGMVGMFAGLVAQNMAQSTQAQADIREWEQLPGTVWLGTGNSKVASDKLLVAVQATGSFGGVGVSMDPDGSFTVLGVTEGGPAARAGLKPGDVVTSVAGTPVAGLSTRDFIAKLRGEPNTAVAVAVNRPSEGRSVDVTITREQIVNPVGQVVAKRLADTQRCQLYWGRVGSPMDTLKDAGPLEPGEHPRDPAFRQDLQSFFSN